MTNIPFKTAQTIRLLMCIALFVIWLIAGFIIVRQVFFYINFWALTFMMVSELWIGMAAGRSIVEAKMLKVKQEENNQAIIAGRKS